MKKSIIIFLIALGIGISSIHAQLLVTARATNKIKLNTSAPSLWEAGYTYYVWGKTYDDGGGGRLSQPRDIKIFIKLPYDPGMNNPLAQGINLVIGEPGQGFFKKAFEAKGLYPTPVPVYDTAKVQIGWEQPAPIPVYDTAKVQIGWAQDTNILLAEDFEKEYK